MTVAHSLNEKKKKRDSIRFSTRSSASWRELGCVVVVFLPISIGALLWDESIKNILTSTPIRVPSFDSVDGVGGVILEQCAIERTAKKNSHF